MNDKAHELYQLLNQLWKQAEYPANIGYYYESDIKHSVIDEPIRIRISKISNYLDKLGNKISDYKLDRQTVQIYVSVAEPSKTDDQQNELLEDVKSELLDILKSNYVEDELDLVLKQIPHPKHTVDFPEYEETDIAIPATEYMVLDINGEDKQYRYIEEMDTIPGTPLLTVFGWLNTTELSIGTITIIKQVLLFKLPSKIKDYTISKCYLNYKIYRAYLDAGNNFFIHYLMSEAVDEDFIEGAAFTDEISGRTVEWDASEWVGMGDIKSADLSEMIADYQADYPDATHIPLIVVPGTIEGEDEDYIVGSKSLYHAESGDKNEALEEWRYKLDITLKKTNKCYIENISVLNANRAHKHAFIMNLTFKEVIE